MMKRQNAFVVAPICFLLAACGAERSEEDEYVGEVDPPEAHFRPEAAVAAMKAAESNNLQPQFHACPYYLTYEPIGFDEYGNNVSGWTGAQGELFVVNKPTWLKIGGFVVIMCGTTQSPHVDWMNVRKSLAGYTQCTTSTIGSPNAWFVCT